MRCRRRLGWVGRDMSGRERKLDPRKNGEEDPGGLE
jgi:hypothetical protein